MKAFALHNTLSEVKTQHRKKRLKIMFLNAFVSKTYIKKTRTTQ